MALELAQRYNTRDLAIEVDSGARTVLPGTNVSFSVDPITGAITINASGGGTGTVTSVGLAAPTGLTVSGSPVTTTGTLTLTYTAGYQGYTSTEATKLSGIATGATVGATWGVNLASIPANITSWAAIAPATKYDTSNPAGYITSAALTPYVLKAGDAMSGGLGFGTAVAASPADLTRHIALYSSTYGFSVTGARLNYNVPTSGTHRFVINGTDVGFFDPNGVNDMIGNVRQIPQVVNNASAAFVIADAGKHKIKTNSTAYTYTVPLNSSVAFPVGTAITIVNTGGTTNNITIALTGGVTLYRGGVSGGFTVAPGGMVTLLKIGTDSWQA